MTTPADEPLLDPYQFAEMCDLLGSDQTSSLLRMFLHDLTARPAAIVASCDAGDAGEARRGAHALKGAALSIGARRIAGVAAAIERAADHDRRRLCRDLPGCAVATRDLIEALLPEA